MSLNILKLPSNVRLFGGAGLLILVVGCTGAVSPLNKTQEARSQEPIRSLTLTVDKDKREALFSELRKFAADHEFQIQFTDFNTNGENFQFSMTRSDITIIAGDVPPDPALVYVDFEPAYPGYPVDKAMYDKLLIDLERGLNQIPGITVRIEK